MSILRMILSWIYGFFVGIRNILYDEHLLHSSKVSVPTICIGNLAVGGTGKTPHTEALARMLSAHYKVAILSRGYKRKSKGFQLVDSHSSATSVGDEAMQMYLNLPDVKIAVCENRVKGCRRLQRLFPDTDVILLDDGFQHRRLQCGYYILLTAANKLFVHDHLLPYGRLREHRYGSLRANMVIVSKCPSKMRPIDKRVIDSSLNLPTYQHLLFSWLRYGEQKPLFPDGSVQDASSMRKPLVLTGIADVTPMLDYLRTSYPHLVHLGYSDHHRYSARDIQRLKQCYEQNRCDGIITTQKDAVRLIESKDLPEALSERTWVLPVEVDMRGQEAEWLSLLSKYINENKQKIRKEIV